MRNVTLRQMRVFAAVARYAILHARGARAASHAAGRVAADQAARTGSRAAACSSTSAGTIHLTAAGEELLRYATQVTELLREAGESLAAMRGLKRGVLKLGAVSTAKYFAPSLLSAFAPAYPDVTIRFAVGNREEIIQLLAANEIDLVIMGRPPRELVTVAAPFAKHPLVIIASPNHPLATQTAHSAETACQRELRHPRGRLRNARGDGARLQRAWRRLSHVDGSQQQRDDQAGGDGRDGAQLHLACTR